MMYKSSKMPIPVLSLATVTYTSFILMGSLCLRSGISFAVFQEHGISSSWTGFIECSIIAGYITSFLLGMDTKVLSRFTTRQCWMGLCITATCALLVNGFIFCIHHRSTILVVSVVTRALQGANGYIATMMVVDSLKLLAPEKFDSLLGLVGAAQMLGMTLSVTICNLIVDNLGYTPAFVIFAALALVALGICFAFLPTGPTFCSTSTRPEVNFLLYLRRFKID